MKRLTVFLSVFAFGCLIAGCTNSTPVQDEPLPEAERQELECTLLGKWKHTHIDGEPVQTAQISWDFRADGSGTYTQVVPTIGQRATQSFMWTLEGRNIYLNLEKNNKETVYRADNWTDSKMKWFNYRLSDNYTVQRVEDAIGECP
jgi:hypothetical protein